MENVKIKDQNLYYKPGETEYRIRGFEDVILSHLRVNIKVTVSDDFFIDIVDLYSQKSRTQFINKLCRQLDMKREDAKKDIYKIIDIIERYQSSKNKPEKKKEIKISDKAKQKALKELKDPKLLKNILRDIESLGYIGEEKNKTISYLVSISRKLDGSRN